jgi:hypothetical protein
MEGSGPTQEQLEEFHRATASKVLRGSILIRPPTHPDVNAIAPGRWQPIDELVSELGTQFTAWGHDFDIGEDVEGSLGKGLLGLLILEDATTPRPPTREERAVFSIPDEGAGH